MLAGSDTSIREMNEAIASLKALASYSQVYEIKHAANYIVVNLSHKSTKETLSELKKQLSKLLLKAEDKPDFTAFDNAFNQLMWVLPELPKEEEFTSDLLSHSGIYFSSSSVVTLESVSDNDIDNNVDLYVDNDVDESSFLLEKEKHLFIKTKKKYKRGHPS